MASTDDLVADDDIIAGGDVVSLNARVNAAIGGSITVPNDGDGDPGDVNAADDLRAGDDVLALGTKSAVVMTSNYGARRFYADESTEVYFFDRGQGHLEGGRAFISIDPIFSDSIAVGTPLLVQITPTEDCKGIFVERASSTGFSVKELGGGVSNATFSWEVAAKRRDYENTRLESFGDMEVVETVEIEPDSLPSQN